MDKEKKQEILDQASEVMDTLTHRFASSNTIGVERATIRANEYIALIDCINLLLEDIIDLQGDYP